MENAEPELQYLDPAAVVQKLHGLGAELQGLNVDNPVEALLYSKELAWNALQLIRAVLERIIDVPEFGLAIGGDGKLDFVALAAPDEVGDDDADD